MRASRNREVGELPYPLASFEGTDQSGVFFCWMGRPLIGRRRIEWGIHPELLWGLRFRNAKEYVPLLPPLPFLLPLPSLHPCFPSQCTRHDCLLVVILMGHGRIDEQQGTRLDATVPVSPLSPPPSFSARSCRPFNQTHPPPLSRLCARKLPRLSCFRKQACLPPGRLSGYSAVTGTDGRTRREGGVLFSSQFLAHLFQRTYLPT
ncbi:hypothetical protein LZ32DRAFT_311362 [Colletotrichum eremochloae]|nr:hypothetical protein LZ32DRAFT_311362 [Colletotrichum eremochloae]